MNQSLLTELTTLHKSKKDLIEFYFQNPKNIHQNQLLRLKRCELSLIFCEQVLSIFSNESFDNENLILVTFDKNKVAAKEISNSISPHAFQETIGWPDFYIVLGKFDMTQNFFQKDTTKRFYFEIPSGGFMLGTIDPFFIEQDQIRYKNQKAA